MLLDDAIGEIECGEFAAASFPPLSVVQLDGKVVAIGGNRILFVHRVCAAHGVVQTVRVKLHPLEAQEMQKLRWDERLGRIASKLERSMSSSNGGAWVGVNSRYRHDQSGVFSGGNASFQRSAGSGHCDRRQASEPVDRHIRVLRSPRAASEEDSHNGTSTA